MKRLRKDFFQQIDVMPDKYEQGYSGLSDDLFLEKISHFNQLLLA